MEGEGRSLKGFVTERKKGAVSWVRFGEEGLHNLLKGAETYSKKGGTTKGFLELKENGRLYKLECHKNEPGKFLRCLVIDEEGKRHKIFIPEGRGLIKGWDLLTAKLRELGIKEKTKIKRNVGEINELRDVRMIRVVEDGNKGNPSQGRSFAKVVKFERSQPLNTVWIEVGESLSRDEMGTLKFFLVERWEKPPDSYPSAMEMEA